MTLARSSTTLVWVLLIAVGCSGRAWDPAGGHVAPVASNPFVHQAGRRLVDGSGAPVVLRSVNLGGWLLWEGWIWGAGWQGQAELLRKLAELVGPDEAVAFERRVFDEFIREEDIAEIARLGFNSVRVPFNHTLLEDDAAPFTYEASGWAVLDRLLGWCETHGIMVILDLHAAPGGQSPFYMADPDPTLLWDSLEAQDRTVALWGAIAGRYRDRAIIAGYDLLNEPAPPSGEALVALYDRIAAAIREVDSRHLLIVEGTAAASDFSAFTRPISDNQAYSFHLYTFFGDWRRDELGRHAAISEAHGIPLWAGEYGLMSLELNGSTAALCSSDEFGVSGSAFWTWKMTPGGTPGLAELTAEMPAFRKLAKWLESGWNPRPTADEARAGMDELLEASRLANCTVNAELAAALVP